MAKFYFHLRYLTDQLLDPDGVGCANANVMATKAMAAARDCISQDAAAGVIDMQYRIDVEDTSYSVVHSAKSEDAVTIERAP